jgi:hypothetical protein
MSCSKCVPVGIKPVRREAAVAGVGGLVMTDEILFWRVGRIASMLHLVVGRSNWRKWSCRMVRSIPFSLLFALVQISLF